MAVFLTAISSPLGDVPTSTTERHSHCETPDSQVELLRQAFFFAFPIYEMSRMRQRMLSLPGAEPNKLLHRTTLSRPSDRSITTPNHDTLYSTAWLDLAEGPVEFSIPPMGTRYHSVELMHVFSDAFGMLRNESDATRSYLIVGPQWIGQVPPNLTLIRSPTRDAWLVIRTFVEGPSDLAEAQNVQASYALSAHRPRTGLAIDRKTIPMRPDAVEFLAVVNSALARGRLPPDHRERLDCFAETGIKPSGSSTAETVAPGLIAAWDANIGRFYEEARSAFENAGSLVDGWRYPAPHIATFGTDDVYRSGMALGGLAAMPLEEAMNPIAVSDAAGMRLSGSNRYRLNVPANVPVEEFWSLTMYEAGEAGRWYLYENALDRYAINSTMSGLHRETDGSIIVEISHDTPDQTTNWLPSPEGEFMLVFRAYRPQRALVHGSFRLPPIQRTE